MKKNRLLGIFEPCDAWLEAEKIKFLQNPNNKMLLEKFSSGYRFEVREDFYEKIPKFLMGELEKKGKYYFAEWLWAEKYDGKKVKLMRLEEE